MTGRSLRDGLSSQAIEPVPVSPADAASIPSADFRIVSLHLSRRDQLQTTFSITQHWGEWLSDDAALGACIARAAEIKPGFSVDQWLIAAPFASVDRSPKGEDPQGLGAKHESAVAKPDAQGDQP